MSGHTYHKVPRCRQCGREIAFALSEKGKRMPLDPINVDRSRDPDAQYALYEDPYTGADRVHFINSENPLVEGEEIRVRSHFASCPGKRSRRGSDVHAAERIPSSMNRKAVA